MSARVMQLLYENRGRLNRENQWEIQYSKRINIIKHDIIQYAAQWLFRRLLVIVLSY